MTQRTARASEGALWQLGVIAVTQAVHCRIVRRGARQARSATAATAARGVPGKARARGAAPARPERALGAGAGAGARGTRRRTIACWCGAALAPLLRQVLAALGEDPDREGLRRMPERWARALCEYTGGRTRTRASTFASCSSSTRTSIRWAPTTW